MNRKTKRWLIAAAVLIAVGLIMVSVAVAAAYREHSFEKLDTTQFVTNTYGINEKFSRISVDTDIADIFITTAEDGRCSVVCYEPEKLRHTVNVQNGTLTVEAVDEREWADRVGIHFTSPKITISLPGEELASLVIEESTGDIAISNLTAGTIDLSVSTGSVTVADVVCKDLLSHGSTGEVLLRYVSADENISIERSTGDVHLENSDAAEIYVKTSTGDITGSLRSEKVFLAESSTGEVSVPQSATGGKCLLISATGDILFSVQR